MEYLKDKRDLLPISMKKAKKDLNINIKHTDRIWQQITSDLKEDRDNELASIGIIYRDRNFFKSEDEA